MVEPLANSVLPSAVSSIGSLGCTTPILPIWPFWLDTVPSPAMVIWVSVGASWIGCPLLSSTALPAVSAMVPLGSRPNRPSRVSRGPPGVLTVKYPLPVTARSNGLPVWVIVPACCSRQVARSWV